ncbi:MAG: GTPase [Phycisphaerae bacterium]|nr:MAG: GTPase [Phycisphaerae bacterium]
MIILGAAGRDFHDFNVYWKNRDDIDVICFTAAQIPDIDGRTYPAELAGKRYPEGIPIYPEADLKRLIKEHRATMCSMSYSDTAHVDVMHKASLVNAAGANFALLGTNATMIASKKPVIAVCAVRTGCGKSQTTRAIANILKSMGKRTVAVRHPMPYGDLREQICQRYASISDMDHHKCTIEEREEYELHIEAGNIVYAGVDYQRILDEAEKEADVVLWDGGNNDTPFYKPDLYITVVDPHRPGHEIAYYPGETNLRAAHVVIVNKMGTADQADIDEVLANVRDVNPGAEIIECNSPLTIDGAEQIKGKRVLCVEDGPTVSHGEMPYGAAHVAAEQNGAAEIIDPRPFATGSIKDTFEKYPHCQAVLPAMGYGAAQISELEKTINDSNCDLVLIGTPIDLGRMLKIEKPHLRIGYELKERNPGQLEKAVRKVVG